MFKAYAETRAGDFQLWTDVRNSESLGAASCGGASSSFNNACFSSAINLTTEKDNVCYGRALNVSYTYQSLSPYLLRHWTVLAANLCKNLAGGSVDALMGELEKLLAPPPPPKKPRKTTHETVVMVFSVSGFAFFIVVLTTLILTDKKKPKPAPPPSDY